MQALSRAISALHVHQEHLKNFICHHQVPCILHGSLHWKIAASISYTHTFDSSFTLSMYLIFLCHYLPHFPGIYHPWFLCWLFNAKVILLEQQWYYFNGVCLHQLCIMPTLVYLCISTSASMLGSKCLCIL